MDENLYQNSTYLTLTLTQGQPDGWVGVDLKGLLLVKLHTKYERNYSRGSKVISKC